MNSPPPAVARVVLTRGETQIEILAQGEGPPVVLLPSLGRGAADFDDIAARLAVWFGTSPQFWMNLQIIHDVRVTCRAPWAGR